MTTHVVADETLGMIARKQWDLFRRVKEGTLDPEKVSDALQAAIEGRFNGSATPTFLRDMTKKGWTLVEDVPGEPLPASKLEFGSFLKRGEDYISGEEMRKRTKEKNANLGQRQAEYLLENQEEIPEEFRNYYLVFPGTVWCDRCGHLDVPYLAWGGMQWVLNFRWLERVWDSRGRLVGPRK